MRKNTQAALCRGMNVNYYKKNLAACLQGVLPKLCQYFSHSLSSPPSNANKFLYPPLSSLAFNTKKKQPYIVLKCQLITFQSVNIYIKNQHSNSLLLKNEHKIIIIIIITLKQTNCSIRTSLVFHQKHEVGLRSSLMTTAKPASAG